MWLDDFLMIPYLMFRAHSCFCCSFSYFSCLS
uniref:Uncharacterized protein n=1 Tax=Arundo donax TaxID=35708 RepID=A0A0A9F5K0_ARUDO